MNVLPGVICVGKKQTNKQNTHRAIHLLEVTTQCPKLSKNRGVYTSWQQSWQWWRKYNVNTSQHACKEFFFLLILPMWKLMMKTTFSTSDCPLGFTTVTVWCWTVSCSHHVCVFFVFFVHFWLHPQWYCNIRSASMSEPETGLMTKWKQGTYRSLRL